MSGRGTAVTFDVVTTASPTIPEPPEEWAGEAASDWASFFLAERGYDVPASALRHLDAAPPDLAAALHDYKRAARRGLVDGLAFADVPVGTPAIWGAGQDVLWAKDEGVMISGPNGVRKTTTALTLVLGLAGVPGFDTYLGLPVTPLPAGRRVLYFAMDRPAQISRVWARLIRDLPDEHKQALRERVIFWRGPMPDEVDPANGHTGLAAYALEQEAGAVVLDSLKDVNNALSDEKVGSEINKAVQECLVCDVQALVLHHPRKAGNQNKNPNKLDDIHGSANLVRGMGSVISLWGDAGASVITLTHLKPAADIVGPLPIVFDYTTGRGHLFAGGADTSALSGEGAKAERCRKLMQHFLADMSTRYTLDDLVATGKFGGERVLRDALAALVDAGLVDADEKPGVSKTWGHHAPLQQKGDADAAD